MLTAKVARRRLCPWLTGFVFPTKGAFLWSRLAPLPFGRLATGRTAESSRLLSLPDGKEIKYGARSPGRLLAPQAGRRTRQYTTERQSGFPRLRAFGTPDCPDVPGSLGISLPLCIPQAGGVPGAPACGGGAVTETEMVLGAGLEPARTLLAGTSPCLRYSESHGAERYNSGSSQRASAGVSSRGQTWFSNPSLCAGGQKPSDPYISRPDIAAVHLPSAFFRVSSRFAAPSRRAVEPPPRVCHFPPAQVKS